MEFKVLNDLNNDIISIRTEAFIEGRGVPPEIEIDGKDPYLLHFCLYDGIMLVAYLRAEAMGGMLHIGRVCVRKTERNKGLGRQLVNYLFEYSVKNGFCAVELSAVDTAVGFYEKMGFCPEGEFYLETGVPHIYMKKIL